MILSHNFNRLVGIALLMISSLHEIRAFVGITPSVSGTVNGRRSGEVRQGKTMVSRFQRSDFAVRSSGSGLSEWVSPDLPYLSNGAESTFSFATPSTTLSAATLDPTTLLSDIFGSVLGTPLILAIPIVAALLVATLIAYGIVAYANPAEDEE